jgi:3-dehydro-L-gulonate 2-dehydrogenase
VFFHRPDLAGGLQRHGTEMMISVTFKNMKSEFVRILTNLGFTESKADQCADIFALNSLEGVYSHGVNRFPRFVLNVQKGYVKPDSVPSVIKSLGSLEQWNGNLGPGPLNALFATERAMELASQYGIGLVAMGNTNHWMRGGTYGWKAARKGFSFLGWTNTEPNMPAWGAKDFRLGNNPLVFAVPYGNEAIVLDFAMSQFSYGRLETYQLEGKQLPYPGGFNKNGNLTTCPGEIIETRRALPIGYWKGSGLSLLLDILASIVSGGLSTFEISQKEAEYALSQVFIAISLENLSNHEHIETTVRDIIKNYKESVPAESGIEIRFPGENVVKVRENNTKNGIPVNTIVWETILAL